MEPRTDRHAPLKVLLVEDNMGDADLVLDHLHDDTSPYASVADVVHVTRLSDARDLMVDAAFDVVLLDLDLPDATGMSGLHDLHRHSPEIPIVVLTGGDERGEEAIANGAQDFLPKAIIDPDRFARTVRYAIARARLDRKLRSIALNNADAVLVVSEAGIVLFANSAAERMFGRRRGELIGEVFGYPIEPRSKAEVNILSKGQSRAAEMKVAHIEWDGEAAFLASLRDITDRKRAEDLQNRLFHADRLSAIGQLAAGVAHEVNNPAQYLLTNFSRLREAVTELTAALDELRGRRLAADGGEPERAVDDVLAERRVDNILYDIDSIAAANSDGVERIVQIVGDLRSFSRIERDDAELVNINDVLDVACRITLNEVRHRATLIKNFADVPEIVADRGKLCQVFTNLLVNAAQAIQEGAAEVNQIRVSTRVDHGTIVVSVEDTGDGMPPHVQSHIFEPFFTTKPREYGTGLGLPISAEIIRKHGGEITVESTEGVGTRFDTVLPIVSTMKLPKVHAEAHREPLIGRRARVLVIDDEKQIVMAFRRMLKAHHDVDTVCGGADAVKHLEANVDYDVVICDLMMPQVDGKQIYEFVQERAPRLVSRIVFCSGGAFTQRVQTFLRSIKNTCLDKPVDHDVLLEVIGRLAATTDPAE